MSLGLPLLFLKEILAFMGSSATGPADFVMAFDGRMREMCRLSAAWLGPSISHSHGGASTLILIWFPCCQFDRELLLSVLCCATEPARKMICSAKPMPVKVQLFTLVAAPTGRKIP